MPLKISDLKPGDVLTGFTFWECVPERAKRAVRRDRGLPSYKGDRRLYVTCSEGKHFLDGQVGNHGALVNCRRVTPKKA
jgi:hypothetical protein